MVRRIGLLLALAGVLISGYLTLTHLRGAYLTCFGHGCDTVQQSRYAQVGPFPTAAFGLIYFLWMTCFLLMEWLGGRQERLLKVSMGLSVAAAAVSIALTAIEAFEIHAYCSWCLASAAICLTLAPITFCVLRRDDVQRDRTLTLYDRDRKFALVALVVSAFIGLRGGMMIKPPPETARQHGKLPKFLTQENHALGSPKAPHKILEFADFQCPRCKGHYQALRKFMKTDTGRIRWVYRSLPLKTHKWAIPAAIAAEAAAEQGKFFEMADLLYENQPRFRRRDLERYARELGLDVKRFRLDMKKDSVKQRLASDLQAAGALMVTSVPTIYVDGALSRKIPTLDDLAKLAKSPPPVQPPASAAKSRQQSESVSPTSR